MLRRSLRAQSWVTLAALLVWTLVPPSAIAPPSSAGRSLDAPDYYEVAAAVGKDGLDAALTTAPCTLNVPQPIFQPQESHALVAWHGPAFDRTDARSPPSA